MTAPFTYSILQYRHSLALGEAINVGILFRFPEAERLEFVAGNTLRLKAIYSDFDAVIYNYLIRNIEKQLKEDGSSLFRHSLVNADFKRYISSSILPEDATALQFTEPVSVLGTKHKGTTADQTAALVREFSHLLLPGIVSKKTDIVRHNEQFLIRRFTGYIFTKHKELEKKIGRNKIIKTKVDNNEIELKFDLSWQNGSTNLIKPLSFDLSDEKNIQDKSAVNFGYLNLLDAYAKNNNCRFDFIVSKPQDKNLYKAYDNALGLLELSPAPKRIITEPELKSYSEETIEQLLQH